MMSKVWFHTFGMIRSVKTLSCNKIEKYFPRLTFYSLETILKRHVFMIIINLSYNLSVWIVLWTTPGPYDRLLNENLTSTVQTSTRSFYDADSVLKAHYLLVFDLMRVFNSLLRCQDLEKHSSAQFRGLSKSEGFGLSCLLKFAFVNPMNFYRAEWYLRIAEISLSLIVFVVVDGLHVLAWLTVLRVFLVICSQHADSNMFQISVFAQLKAPTRS